jgi:Fe-coproporphyrin III synthase
MSGVIAKAGQALSVYRELIVEQPSPTRVKRFLIAVNGWCNSRCTFCNIWKYDKALALREEITLEDLERNLFTARALADVRTIGITGGEPFLRRDLVAVCRSMYAHFPKAELSFVTNGLRPERIAETAAEIARADPSRQVAVAVSLDGYGATHDTVRGVPGNFERVVKTVELLRATAPAVVVGFSHTITPTNLHDSLRCHELAEELGIGFIYRLAHESSYLRNEGTPIWSPEALAAVRGVVAELNRRLVARQSLLARLSNINYAGMGFYRETMDYFEDPRRTFDCFSGTHSFFLTHDGDVLPCINLPHAMGNIRRQSFDDFWLSRAAADLRAPIAAWQCHCWTNCETELSLARSKATFVRSMGENLRGLLPMASSRP